MHCMHHGMKECTVRGAVQATTLALLDELFSELSGPIQTAPQYNADLMMRRLVYRGCE